MKQFKFNLESVLMWKRRQEESALQAFGEATRKKNRAIDDLQNARRYMGELISFLADQRKSETLSAWNQTMFVRAIAHQEGVCRHKEEIVQKLKNEEEVFRQQYLVKHREVEGIVKLKEKRKKIFEKEENDRLEKELEEIVLSRIVRDDYATH